MIYVIRLGAYYLQGETGWGERSCAREFDEPSLRRFLKTFPYPAAKTEPCLHAYIDGVCHRCQEPEPRARDVKTSSTRVENHPVRPPAQGKLF